MSLLDASHAVDFVSIEEAGSRGLLDAVPPSSWYSSARMVARDGTVTAGGKALLALMSELPVAALPSIALGRMRGADSSAALLYGLVSRSHGSACATNTLKPLTGREPR